MAKKKNLSRWGGPPLGDGRFDPPPDLTAEERIELVAILGFDLPEEEWSRIEGTRKTFAEQRTNQVRGVSHTDLEQAANRIKSTAKSLADFIERSDRASDLLWLQFARFKGLEEEIAAFRGGYLALVPALRDLQGLSADVVGFHGPPRKDMATPWYGLVAELAWSFDQWQLKPTAAKSIDADLTEQRERLSQFVRFVWAVLDTLPSELHMHRSGMPESFSAAVADGISVARQHESDYCPGGRSMVWFHDWTISVGREP